MILKGKDLIGLEDLTREEILGILDTAEQFRAIFDRPVRKVPIMRLVVIITPGVPTPRAVMQAWLASMTTATPLG